jgi:hypothetical protein
VKVNTGKWYYEVQLQAGQMQAGWCLDTYDGATTGDSWAYDITNSQIYRKGANPQQFGEYCYTNDTIGVGVDVVGKTITFYRNGRLLGEAWKDVDLPGRNDRLVPFVALSKGSKAKFNFGKDGFTYSQERAGFHALHSKLSEGELKELGKLFSKYKGKQAFLSPFFFLFLFFSFVNYLFFIQMITIKFRVSPELCDYNNLHEPLYYYFFVSFFFPFFFSFWVLTFFSKLSDWI